MARITHFQSSAFRAMLIGLLTTAAFQSTAQQTSGPGQGIFPKGEQGPAQNFTGKAWNYGLVTHDSTLTTLVGNVYFEPGARTNWHSHPAGQILIITDGAGYHQIQGGPRESLQKGDVVKCPPDILHWHGASPSAGMQQLYIVPNTEKGIVQWKQPVTDKEYNNQP